MMRSTTYIIKIQFIKMKITKTPLVAKVIKHLSNKKTVWFTFSKIVQGERVN